MENQSAQQSASQNNEENKSETPTIIPTPTQTNTEATIAVEEVKQPQVISAPVVETPQPPAQVEEAKEPIVSPPKIETPVVQPEAAPKQPDVKVSIPIESKDQERTTIQNSNIIDKVDNSVSQENSIKNSGLNVALDSQENTSFSVQNKNQEDSSLYLKLFVGGLYYQTEEDVNNYFAKYGEIVDCQLLRHRQTGRSRGFAFVTIRDPTGSVKKVLLGRRNEINGKYVDIKLAEDNKTREKIEQSSCKVFVGGIEGSVSTEELRDYFQVMGNVKEAVVLKNIIMTSLFKLP